MLPLPEACAALCPGFVASGRPWRARKSELMWGAVGDQAVVAKRPARPDDPVAAWYAARERTILAGFAADPPPVRAPRLVASAGDLLVMERLPGAPLATRRRPAARLPAATLDRLVDGLGALAAWSGRFPDQPPPAPVARAIRARYLEDPTDPAWVRPGRRAARLTIDPDLAATVDRALDGAPLAAAHGDLLLRNVIADHDGAPGLCDWECAGHHPAGWDLALLWSQLDGQGRAAIDAVAAAGPDPRWRRRFPALCAVALVRELHFLRAFGVARTAPAQVRLRAELTELVERLAGVDQ